MIKNHVSPKRLNWPQNDLRGWVGEPPSQYAPWCAVKPDSSQSWIWMTSLCIIRCDKKKKKKLWQMDLCSREVNHLKSLKHITGYLNPRPTHTLTHTLFPHQTHRGQKVGCNFWIQRAKTFPEKKRKKKENLILIILVLFNYRFTFSYFQSSAATAS